MVSSLVLIAINMSYKKTLYKTLDYWMLSFDLLGKGLGIVFPPIVVYDFSRKMFLKLYCMNWPNVIVWMPLLLEILELYWNCLFPVFDIVNFVFNLVFWIKQFFYVAKKSWERREILRWNIKNLSSFVKGFQFSKLVSDLRVCL